MAGEQKPQRLHNATNQVPSHTLPENKQKPRNIFSPLITFFSYPLTKFVNMLSSKPFLLDAQAEAAKFPANFSF